MTRIGARCLESCYALTSVEMPACLTDLDAHAFSWCPKLQRIDLQHTALATIGHTFANRSNSLTTVYLPDTVTTVGSGFLTGCGGCVDVVGGTLAVKSVAENRTKTNEVATKKNKKQQKKHAL